MISALKLRLQMGIGTGRHGHGLERIGQGIAKAYGPMATSCFQEPSTETFK